MPINHSDQQFFELLASHKPPADETSNQTPDIHLLREGMKAFSEFVGDAADIPYTDKYITAKAGHKIRLRYYAESNDKKPLIVYFPGNGFIYDLFEENHSIISKMTKEAQCHAVMVEFRLAPENPYPAPLEDALEAIKHIYNHADEFHADKNKLILSGYSSGGNLAAVATNQLRKDSDIHIYHQVLISGGFDYTNSVHDFDDYALQDKLLDPEAAQYSFDCYCSVSDRKDPMCSPYWEKDLSGLPNTTIVCAEYDGGRSHSEAYAKRLIEAGNNVEKIILPGQTHGTIMFRKACCDGEDPAVVIGQQIALLL